MKNRSERWCILSLLALFFIFLAFNRLSAQTRENDGWKLAKDKQGIKIYTRSLEGSKLKEFKAYTELNTSIEILAEVLMDVEHYTDWTENIKHSKLLKEISDKEIIIYSELKVPWPFDNRDVVDRTQIYWSVNKDSFTLEIKSIPDYIQEKEEIVRMPLADGGWEIYRKGNDKISVAYHFAADPGGRIPSWLVNMFIVDGPYKTLNNLKVYLRSYSK
jgi:hypothetical protein